jgi:hypothetical protein
MDPHQLAEQVRGLVGQRLDILVANAGVSLSAPILQAFGSISGQYGHAAADYHCDLFRRPIPTCDRLIRAYLVCYR